MAAVPLGPTGCRLSCFAASAGTSARSAGSYSHSYPYGVRSPAQSRFHGNASFYSGRIGARVSRLAEQPGVGTAMLKASAVKPERQDVDGSDSETVDGRGEREKVLAHLERLLQGGGCSSKHEDEAEGSSSVGSKGDRWNVKLEEEKPSSSKSKDSSSTKGNDFYANLGYAIRTLREDTPTLFSQEPNFDIYRDDIVFKDPRNKFKGIDNYKLINWSLRFHGRIFFRNIYVEVKRLWQTDDKTIRMRWTVHGFPRVPWEAEGTFDGVSEFRLDSDGKIYQHSVDNVIFRDPPGERLPLFARLNLTPVAQQQPVPGGWCFSDEEETSDNDIGVVHFSWIRLYLSVALLPRLQSIIEGSS